MGELNNTDKSALNNASKVLISATDTTPGTLDSKVVGGTYVAATVLNPSGNAQVNLQKSGSPTDTLVKVSATDTTAAVLNPKFQLANSTSGLQITDNTTSLSLTANTASLPTKFPSYTGPESIAWDLKMAVGASSTENPTYGGAGASDVMSSNNMACGVPAGPFGYCLSTDGTNVDSRVYTPSGRNYPIVTWTLWVKFPTRITSDFQFVTKNYYTLAQGTAGPVLSLGFYSATGFMGRLRYGSGSYRNPVWTIQSRFPINEWFLLGQYIEASTGRFGVTLNGYTVAETTYGALTVDRGANDGPWTIGAWVGGAVATPQIYFCDFRVYSSIPTNSYLQSMYRRVMQPSKMMGFNRDDTY